MSDKSSAEKQLQSDAINFSAIARGHLAQFAAAAAKNYKPVAQSQPITEVPTTTTKTTTKLSRSSESANSSTANSNADVQPSPPASSPATQTTSALNPAAQAPPSNPTAQPSPPPSNAGASTSNAGSTNPKPATTNQVANKGYVSATGLPSHANKQEIVIATPFQPPMVNEFDTSKVTSCKFVLLDPYILEVADDYTSVTGTFQWEACQDQVERCIDFLKNDCAKKRTFLVCSGGLGQHTVPKIHELSQLYAIYVYCGNVMFHKEWAKNYKKIRMVCDNDKRYLIPQLATDVAQTFLEYAVDILKKGGDKEKAKKKLEQALKNVEEHMKENPHPELAKEIKKRLDECK